MSDGWKVAWSTPQDAGGHIVTPAPAVAPPGPPAPPEPLRGSADLNLRLGGYEDVTAQDVRPGYTMDDEPVPGSAAAAAAPAAPAPGPSRLDVAMWKYNTNQVLTAEDMTLIQAQRNAEAAAINAHRGGGGVAGFNRKFQAGNEEVARHYNQMAEREAARALQMSAEAAGNTAVMDSHNQRLAEDIARRQEAMAAHQQRMDQLEADITKSTADYQKAAQSLDPHRLLRGREWIAGLAMALGAYGATLGHTANFAQQIISSAVDRDIDAQKSGIAAKREAVSMAGQMYQMNRQKFGDDEAARAFTHSQMNEIFANKMGARAEAARGTQAAHEHLQQQSQFQIAAAQEKQRGLQILDTRGRAAALAPVKPDDVVAETKAKAEAVIVQKKAAAEGSDESKAEERARLAKVKGAEGFIGLVNQVKQVDDQSRSIEGWAGGVVSRLVNTSAADQERTDIGATADQYAKAVNGGHVTENDTKRATSHLAGRGVFGLSSLTTSERGRQSRQTLVDLAAAKQKADYDSGTPEEKAALERAFSVFGEAGRELLRTGRFPLSSAGVAKSAGVPLK